METLEAYDLVGSYHGAAELAGCDPKTVNHYVERRDAGVEPDTGLVRSSIIDGFRPKIEELVERSRGKIRADVVHERLVAIGFDGSKRTTRRAVADAKTTTARGGVGSIGRGSPSQERGCSSTGAPAPRSPDGDVAVLRVAGLVPFPGGDPDLGPHPGHDAVVHRRDPAPHRGAPTYALTDNEKTVTSEHIAGVPVRHPDMASAGRPYGMVITTCLPADPESKGGSEATVKIATADLVPTTPNLRDGYDSFAELRAETAIWCEKINARPHRETHRPPVDMLAEEQARLHPIPADPYVAALGETRVVTRSSVISLGGTRYSVPHQLIDQSVFVRVEGDEVVIAHRGRDGVREVARHRTASPGEPQLDRPTIPPGRPPRSSTIALNLGHRKRSRSSRSDPVPPHGW